MFDVVSMEVDVVGDIAFDVDVAIGADVDKASLELIGKLVDSIVNVVRMEVVVCDVQAAEY